MQTCYTYDSATKRLTPAPKYATIDGAAVINPTREQCARMTPPAYPLADPMPPAPTPPEGKIAVPDGYEPVDTPDGKEWRQKWRYEDAPPPPVKAYSKYRLVLALQKEEVWPRVKAWLEATPGAYDLYLAAEDISGDEELLASGIEAAKEAFGWDDEKVAEILEQAEVG